MKKETITMERVRKMVDYLARNTKYGKTVNDEDITLYYELSKFSDIDFLAKKANEFILSGQTFPTPFEWGRFIGILKKPKRTLEEDSAWIILMELRQAAQDGDDTGLSNQSKAVLRAHGLSFYDYRYQDKARDKITVTSILRVFRAMPKEHIKQEPEQPKLPGGVESLPYGVEVWKHPVSGKEILFYAQGIIPGDKRNNDRVRQTGRTIDDKKGPWYDHSIPFSERLKLMMDDVDKQLGRGKYNPQKDESMLERRKKLIGDLGMDIKNFGDLA